MLTERTELSIRARHEDAFAAMMATEGKPLLLGFPGVLSARLGRGVERPGRFMLLVEWTEMAAHDAYSGSEEQARLRALMSAFTEGGSMEHFEMEP